MTKIESCEDEIIEAEKQAITTSSEALNQLMNSKFCCRQKLGRCQF